LMVVDKLVERRNAVVCHVWRSAMLVAAANGFLHIAQSLFWGFAAQTKEFGPSSANIIRKLLHYC
jgi:hypothetical protein